MIRYQFTSDWYHFYFHQIYPNFTANNKIKRRLNCVTTGCIYLSIYAHNLADILGLILTILYPIQANRVGGWVVRRCHVSFVTRGVQLILAYSWARPAILVAGKGREVMFLFLLFLHFHSCFSFFPVPPFHLFCYLFCLFSPFLWETTQNDPQGLTCR